MDHEDLLHNESDHTSPITLSVDEDIPNKQTRVPSIVFDDCVQTENKTDLSDRASDYDSSPEEPFEPPDQLKSEQAND